MDLEVRHLRLVVAVAEHGSISGAAATLGLAQPAVSSQLRRIETVLGGPLFTRGPGGVVLTDLGHTVVEEAEPVISAMRRLDDARARSLAGEREALRVGGNTSSAYTRFLPAAVEAIPHPVVSRSDISSRVLMDWLRRDELDLVSVGVHPGYDDRVADPSIEQLVYVEDEPFFVAIAETHPLAGARDLSLQDLRDEDWLLPPGRPDGTMTAFRDAFARAGFEPRTPHGRADLTHYPHLVAGEHAIGVATPTFLPPPGVCIVPLRHRALAGRLVVRWKHNHVAQFTVTKLRRLLAAAFVDQVLDASRGQAWWDATPQYRPTLAADLVADVDQRLLEAPR